jgi:DNA-binding transcriptional MerR regulator
MTASTFPPQYPIRAVARMTGLSVDTLRAWERRHEAVVPARTDRGRFYSDADVARLVRLADLVKRGHAIGTIAGLSDDALDDLVSGAHAHRAVTAGAASAVIASFDALMTALDAYDLTAIESLVNRHAAVLPPRDLVFTVVLPLLRTVGERWEAGELRPAQEHLVSSIVRSVLGSLLRASGRPDATPRIVFATPSGERHELGLLSAALLAASAGYGAVYVGPDLPAADIAHAAATSGARVVMLALTTPGVVSRRELREFARLASRVDLWIGGPDAPSLLHALDRRARHVASLDDVLPLLERHVR